MKSVMRRPPLLALIAFTIVASFRLSAAGTNRNFAQWEKEIKAFESSDRTNPPPKHCLLFTGSSTVRKWTTLAQDFPGQPVVNRGVGGSEVVDITHFADRIVFPYEPKMIFFRCGGNDIANGKSPEQVFADFKEFVALVRTKLPDTEIVFMSWSPTIARLGNRSKEATYNKLVKEFVKENPHMQYCDMTDLPLDKDGNVRPELFQSDKLHFNAAGNRLMAERVRPFLPK
jgi:lysophospholipase L1-like esterase